MAIRSPSNRCACSAIILHLSIEAYKRRRTSWFDGEALLPLAGCALSAFRGVAATFFFGLPDRLSLLVTIFMLPEDSSFYRRKTRSRPKGDERCPITDFSFQQKCAQLCGKDPLQSAKFLGSRSV